MDFKIGDIVLCFIGENCVRQKYKENGHNLTCKIVDCSDNKYGVVLKRHDGKVISWIDKDKVTQLEDKTKKKDFENWYRKNNVTLVLQGLQKIKDITSGNAEIDRKSLVEILRVANYTYNLDLRNKIRNVLKLNEMNEYSGLDYANLKMIRYIVSDEMQAIKEILKSL